MKKFGISSVEPSGFAAIMSISFNILNPSLEQLAS
jgi:hypothetical protein